MPTANLNDRTSIEAVYPRDAFAQDCARNALADAAVLHGVRILSEPGPDGAFEVAPARRQTGERDPEGDTAFLAPFATWSGALGSGPGSTFDAADAAREREADYAAFLDRLIETTRTITFKTPSGQDERLKGFRGG